jgi:PilZ domain
MPLRRKAAPPVSVAPSGKERRRFQRTPVSLDGRILGADEREHPCRTLDASPGSVRISTPAPLYIDDQVVLYCNELGRLTGRVARIIGDGSFGIALDATPHKREKLAEILTWLINGRDRDARQDRRMPRAPASGGAIAELADGRHVRVELIDFSMVGAGVRCEVRPMIGEWVRIGQQVGRVARYLDGGFAVDFSPRHGAAPVMDD